MNYPTIPFKSPSTIAIYGSTQVGKTHFVFKLLEYSSHMFEKKPHKVIYCYKTWFEKLKKLEEKFGDKIILHEGKPTQELIDDNTGDQHTIVIIDDLELECTKDKFISSLFCVGSHHKNFTLIYLAHVLFGKDLARTINLNSHYLVLFKNSRDKQQINRLASQILPSDKKYFIEAFNKATSNKYGYLLVDIHPQSEEMTMLRTDIFPYSPTIVYLPHKYKDKKNIEI